LLGDYLCLTRESRVLDIACGKGGRQRSSQPPTAAGSRRSSCVASSEDDWDHYESLHWRAIEEWLADHPEQPGAEELRAAHDRFRGDYFRFKRALLGWAI
jgi:hypothetical protein